MFTPEWWLGGQDTNQLQGHVLRLVGSPFPLVYMSVRFGSDHFKTILEFLVSPRNTFLYILPLNLLWFSSFGRNIHFPKRSCVLSIEIDLQYSFRTTSVGLTIRGRVWASMCVLVSDDLRASLKLISRLTDSLPR